MSAVLLESLMRVSELKVDECLGFVADAEEPDRHAEQIIRGPPHPRGLNRKTARQVHTLADDLEEHERADEHPGERHLKLRYALGPQSIGKYLVERRTHEHPRYDVTGILERSGAEEYPGEAGQGERQPDSQHGMEPRMRHQPGCSRYSFSQRLGSDR